MGFWNDITYPITVTSIKISVLLSYNLMFRPIHWFRFTNYVVGTILLGWFIAVFFTNIFQCNPVSKAWNPEKPGTCMNWALQVKGVGISTAVIDFVILLMPVVPVLRLQLSTVQKGLILASFGLGSL